MGVGAGEKRVREGRLAAAASGGQGAGRRAPGQTRNRAEDGAAGGGALRQNRIDPRREDGGGAGIRAAEIPGRRPDRLGLPARGQHPLDPPQAARHDAEREDHRAGRRDGGARDHHRETALEAHEGKALNHGGDAADDHDGGEREQREDHATL